MVEIARTLGEDGPKQTDKKTEQEADQDNGGVTTLEEDL